jgi:hypothetical protein
MKDFHDFLRQKPFSLCTIVVELNLSYLPDEMIIYMGLVERLLVLRSWSQCSKLMLCSVMADLTRYSSWMGQ